MTIDHVFAGVPVGDYDAGLAWYERLAGRPPDMLPNDNEAVWQVTDTAWFYIVGDVGRAGKSVLTLIVDDLEDHVAGLEERGLDTGAIDTVPGLFRKAVITDPEGNRITFAEDLSLRD